MTTNRLKIAPGFTLDADYIAGASLALLGKRGAGKTFACRVLAECLFDAHVQTVIIDPMGVFWGLRAGADGKKKGGLPIPVFGGEHGDAPLESSAGALMADLAVGEHLSMVLDLSSFGSRTQERTFAAAFLDRLYRTNRDLVHLIVDEADLLAPQKPRREDAHLLVTMENIVRRGRNKGIGITMASQRAAVLNKDVLTQIDGLVALRVAAPQDRDAIRDWVRGQGDEAIWSKIAPSLPGLANGESWWWIPEKKVLKRVQVRMTRTFDSSPTRKRGQASRAPKTFADVDLAAISDRISATIERAKATDPKELTRRIRSLEKELAAKAAAVTEPETNVVHVPMLEDDAVARLEIAAKALADSTASMAAETQANLDRVAQVIESSQGQVRQVTEAVDSLTAALAKAKGEQVQHRRRADRPERTIRATEGRPATPARRVSPAPRSNSAAGSHESLDVVTPARRRILTAAASLEAIGIATPRKIQLALWAAVSPKSSGYANNLGALRTAGLIDYPVPGTVGLTDDGRDQAGPVDPIVSDDELHRKVQSLVSPGRWRILAALIDVYPDALSKADLADAAEVSAASSGYANNLGALRSLGLLDYPSPGHVIASDVLFLGGDE